MTCTLLSKVSHKFLWSTNQFTKKISNLYSSSCSSSLSNNLKFQLESRKEPTTHVICRRFVLAGLLHDVPVSPQPPHVLFRNKSLRASADVQKLSLCQDNTSSSRRNWNYSWRPTNQRLIQQRFTTKEDPSTKFPLRTLHSLYPEQNTVIESLAQHNEPTNYSTKYQFHYPRAGGGREWAWRSNRAMSKKKERISHQNEWKMRQRKSDKTVALLFINGLRGTSYNFFTLANNFRRRRSRSTSRAFASPKPIFGLLIFLLLSGGERATRRLLLAATRATAE